MTINKGDVMKKCPPRTTITMRFDNDQLAFIQSEADKRGFNKSAFLSMLVYEFYNKNNKGGK